MINAELVKNNITIPLKEISNKFFVIMDFLPNYKSKSPSEYKNDDLDKVIELIKKMHSIDTSIIRYQKISLMFPSVLFEKKYKTLRPPNKTSNL